MISMETCLDIPQQITPFSITAQKCTHPKGCPIVFFSSFEPFFKGSWEIVGRDITKVIWGFFEHGRMLKQ